MAAGVDSGLGELATINSHTLPTGYQLFDTYEIRAVLQLGVASVRYAATAGDVPVVVEEYFPARLARRRDGVAVGPESARAADEFEAGLSAFLATSRTLAGLRDDSVASMHYWVDANGTGYAVSEAVMGETLGARLEREGTLPDDELRELMQPLIRGLGNAHMIGVLHRQIYPEAIVIRPDGTPVLRNFGIGAKVVGGARQAFEAHTGNLAEIAPGYAALEQYSPGGREGPWTDIYALGAVMYRSTTGMTPADAPFRAAGGDLTPAAHVGDGRDVDMRAAIDAGMAVPIASRPQSLLAWHGMLFRGTPQTLLASRAARTSARGFGRAASVGPPQIAVSRQVARIAVRQGPEDANVGLRALRWAVPALAATGMIAVITWVDTGVLRGNADVPAGVPTPHGYGPVRRNEQADVLRSGGTGPTMVMLPPGRIRLGCFGPGCSNPDAPGRLVVFKRAFALSKYEVTDIDYAPFAAATGRPRPAVVAEGARRPVVNVSWHDAVAYAEWLSEQTGREYRVPSEAEWEYAARAGGDSGTRSDQAVPLRVGAPAGVGVANAWGFHDMLGNVSEWVFDCGGTVQTPAPEDGTAWVQEGCESRVRRHGLWDASSPGADPTAPRTSSDPDRRAPDTGFRVAFLVD
ncbi:MAG: SUMF1/EgtB/PvdO family nonheme iron enzyme [Gammaproteobacteria bacterium]|nr:SUMF1/EgtB/PvdO family nonheme iron enzyme [Gammaproteobacteria bacterium]